MASLEAIPQGWLHLNCGGRVFWDLSGGFCAECDAENLDSDDVERADEG